VNVDVSDEVLELIANLQARVDNLEAKISDLNVNKTDLDSFAKSLSESVKNNIDSLIKTPFEEARDSGEFYKFFSDSIKSSILVSPERFQIKFDTTIDDKRYAAGVGINTEDSLFGNGEFCSCDACSQGEESEPQPFVVIDGQVYINQGYILNGTIEI
jgi:hypothetical protein